MNRFALSILAVALAFLPAIAIEPQASFDRTLTVTGPVELQAATSSGSITVHAGPAGSVRIRGIIRPGSRAAAGESAAAARQVESNPPIQQNGNTIRIGAGVDESLLHLVAIDYEITAPVETHARLRSGSGPLAADGVRGPVDAATGSGAVALTGIQEAVDARTGSGAIEIRQTGANPVKARTGSGAVKVHLPPQAGFDVRARTGSGRLSVAPQLDAGAAAGRHEVSGKLRGGGPLVEVSTGSGPVHIE